MRGIKIQLTKRQKQVLKLASTGVLAKESAHAMGITIRTVDAHRKRVIEIFGARNMTHAVALAIRQGHI